MSGDVQPRKRKDKRRKKDEEDLHHAGNTGPEEIIHIHKDTRLGGNVCAKIVFFCLLGALGVMVGLIITEYRGTTEVETQSASDSPWSLWLDGWLDDGPSHHENEVDIGEIEDDHENSEEAVDSKEELDESNEEQSEEENGDVSDERDQGSEEEAEEEDEDNNDVSDERDEGSEEEDDDDAEADVSSNLEEEEEEENISNEEGYDNTEEENESEEQEESVEQEEEDDDEDESDFSGVQEVEERTENKSEEDDNSEEKFESYLDESDEDMIGEEDDDEGDLDGAEDEEEKSEEKYESEERDESPEKEKKVNENKSDENNESYEMHSDDSNKSGEETLKIVTKRRWLYNRNIDEESHEQELENEDVEQYVVAGSVGTKRVATSSEEKEVDEVTKVSEILRRTSKKVKVGLNDEDEGEEEQKPSEEKKEEVESPTKGEVKDEEGKQEEEGGEEEEEGTTGGEESQHPLEPKEGEVEEEIVPEITRRQTLIPPAEELPTPSIPPQEYDYSEGEEEDEEEDEDEEELVQKTYEDLRAEYQQQITPEGSDIEPTEEDFTTKAPETYDYSPTPPESEPEEEEEPTESDVEEEDDRDPMAEWKKRGPALLAEEVEDVQTGSESEDESPPQLPVVPSRRAGPRASGEQDYENADITNEADWEIREDLDFADADLNNGKPEIGLSKFTALLSYYPHSPRALYGKAKALDQLAEKQRSNQVLASSINTYLKALEVPDIPDELFLRLANRTIDRMRFRGLHLKAVDVHNKLIARFPNNSSHRIDFAITYMMINSNVSDWMMLNSSSSPVCNCGLKMD